MAVIKAGKNEAGQRLDRVLMRYLDKAPGSFVYKMLRKKNITLNGKKAEGNARLKSGDEIRLFLSDETVMRFSSTALKEGREAGAASGAATRSQAAGSGVLKVPVVYEDEDVIFFDKPRGMLSQKAADTDYSLCEYLVDYMLDSGQIAETQLSTFRPSVCNRLDRNTTGLVAAGKTYRGLKALSGMFNGSRQIRKFYRTIVVGRLTEKKRIEGFLLKDGVNNLAEISKNPVKGAKPVCTEYVPLEIFTISGREYTYLEIELVTGRSHQIRAHLASEGHPLIGDPKYGSRSANLFFAKKYGLKYQLLHSYRMEFPALGSDDAQLNSLSGKTFTAPLPKDFACISDSAEERFML